MKKFSEFHQATELTNQDLLLISKWDGVSAYETNYITANLAESVSKKEFIASIEQNSTSAPTITVIKDDFGDTYSGVYNSIGNYEIQGFNGELLGDEEIYVNTNNLQFGTFLRTSPVSTNAIGISTVDNTANPLNDVILVNTYIRVTKYL